MSGTATLTPDGSWADPLSRAECRELAFRLAVYDVRFHNATLKRAQGSPEQLSLYRAHREMSDLHLDVTERARVAAS